MLTVSVGDIPSANIWIEEEMPDLVPELKFRESLFEHLLCLLSLGIPMLDI